MSFLYQDDVLAKFLSDSGLMPTLRKEAQDAAAEQLANQQAALIATKMAKNLMDRFDTNNQSDTRLGNGGGEIYMQDLEDVVHYLNFLYKNKIPYNDKQIVYRNEYINLAATDKNLYSPYEGFYVLKDGLLDNIRKLDTMSNQKGSELMKPPLKNLISELNKFFGLNYSPRNLDLPDNPYDKDSINGKSNSTNNDASNQNHSNPESNSNHRTVYDRSSQSNTNILKQKILQNLPFGTSNRWISPLSMSHFMNNLNELVHSPDMNVSEDVNNQITLFNNNMIINLMSGWDNLITRTHAQTSQDKIDLGGRPKNALQEIFKSNLYATEAAKRLLDMVRLVGQAINSVEKNAPELTNLIGLDNLKNQANLADNFIDEILGPISK